MKTSMYTGMILAVLFVLTLVVMKSTGNTAFVLDTQINEAVTANGNIPSNNGVDWLGGDGVFSVHGTLGGATYKLQSSIDDGTTWVDVTGDDLSITAAGDVLLSLDSRKVRVNVSGGSSISANVRVRYLNR